MIIKTQKELMEDAKQILQEYDPTLDFRPGSILNVAMTPVTFALAQIYENLQEIENNMYLETVSGQFLDLKVEERNLIRKPATNSYILVNSNQEYKDFSLIWTSENDKIEFQINSFYQKNGNIYMYILKSLETGNKTNTLIANEKLYHNNDWVSMIRYTSYAEDIEDDDSLKQRYLETFTSRPMGGNIIQYKEILNNYPDIGAFKVIPAKNGLNGLIYIYILNKDFQPADLVLLNQVQNYLDPTEHTGEGYGVAPIGHRIQVSTVIQYPLKIQLTALGILQSVTLDEIKSICQTAIENYFLELCKNWGNSITLTIYVLNIISYLLTKGNLLQYVESFETPIIIDPKKPDETFTNYTLQTNQIPILQEVILNNGD